MTAAIADEFKTREEAEYRLRKQIQDKAQAVRQEIAREAHLGEEAVSTLQRYLEEDIPAMFEQLHVGQSELMQT